VNGATPARNRSTFWQEIQRNESKFETSLTKRILSPERLMKSHNGGSSRTAISLSDLLRIMIE